MKDGIYIAGPMTGLPEFNFPAFHQAEHDLDFAGWWNIGNPARWDEEKGLDTTGMTGNEKPGEPGLENFDLAETLTMDLTWIAKEATAIALLPGWESSKGVAAEVALAKALGLEVRPYEDFIINEGDPVYVKAGARRLGGEPADIQDVDGVARGYLDIELELWIEAENGDGGYVRIEDVLPFKPQPPMSVSDLYEALTGLPEPTALPDGEERVTSETGGQKGRKAAELATVDPLALLELAKVSGFGARKYASFNYLRGYDWSLSHNALYRHLLEYLCGNDLDEESGLPHITHAAWHALALTSFHLRGVGTDDRVNAVLDGYAKELADATA